MWSEIVTCVASGGAVAAAGTVLARQADRIGVLSGLGRLRVGSLLLASATSLPEITTDVAATRIGAIDLAAGDAIGSSMANMLILALVDLLPPRDVLRRANVDNTLVACLALTLNTMAAIFITSPIRIQIGRVSLGSILIALVYLFGMRVVLRHATGTSQEPLELEPEVTRAAARPRARRSGLARSLAGFGAATAIILVAAPAFARSAAALARELGIAETFLGTLLVGVTTSLPELSSSLAAARFGAFDLAVANLFGSNAFNMVIFFAMDLASPTPIFGAVSTAHVMTVLFANLMMSIGIAAIVVRNGSRRLALIEPSSAAMVLTYMVGLWFLWQRLKS
jgi:cation:H+ antiporter